MAGGRLDIATFRQYANSARKLFKGKEIEAACDALDDLNRSPKSDDNVKSCIGAIKGFTFGDSTAVTIIRFGSIAIIVNRTKAATKELAVYNELAELLGFEMKTSVFEMMNCWGKFFAGLAVVASVADAYLQILDIIDVMEQTQKMVDDLNGKIKASYKDFFQGIKEAAKHYNNAITKKTG
ncbi:hypothetical protein FMUND_9464 [Fusarium mundagurra]|uniref:Uncharacterized protein n=1 Tax=Fusarium mundagurra TaxID=1567541 RepID=A0A8H5YEE5_9HYPO|nr:hypothetical protein FMUND_9464 [Fusarium mundagurra]